MIDNPRGASMARIAMNTAHSDEWAFPGVDDPIGHRLDASGVGQVSVRLVFLTNREVPQGIFQRWWSTLRDLKSQAIINPNLVVLIAPD
jgi:hypothetical protein